MDQNNVCRHYLLLPKHRRRYAVAYAGTDWQVLLPGDLSRALIQHGIQFLASMSCDLNTHADQVLVAIQEGTGRTDLPPVLMDSREMHNKRFSLN